MGPWPPAPERDPRFYYEPAVEAIAEAGVAVEVSTAGLRKPVEELYPASAFAAMCVEAGAAFALSSDAHAPDDVGHAYEQAVNDDAHWGVEEIADVRAPPPYAGAVGMIHGDPERVRVGIGYDAHRFEAGRRLVLGGVEIPHERGLTGHSDADVLVHAVIDAVLGAAGDGDLGTLFPRRRRAVARRPLARPARRWPRKAFRAGGERGCDADLRGAADRPAPCPRWSGTSRARSAPSA